MLSARTFLAFVSMCLHVSIINPHVYTVVSYVYLTVVFVFYSMFWGTALTFITKKAINIINTCIIICFLHKTGTKLINKELQNGKWWNNRHIINSSIHCTVKKKKIISKAPSSIVFLETARQNVVKIDMLRDTRWQIVFLKVYTRFF